MVKIAIVEDIDSEAKCLTDCLERYKRENNEDFVCVRFRDGVSFLEQCKSFDLVFLDIMLPNMTGMEAAEQLRQLKCNIVIIFVTSMAQFALKSYEVDALDYIIKPVSYYRLVLKLSKAISNINANKSKLLMVNDTKNGSVQIETNQLYYIEVCGHKLAYHTENGVAYEYGSLSNLETLLKGNHFMRCNSCYLVNPKFIEKINSNELLVVMKNGETLKISQPRRKSFISELTNWLGQGCY